MSAAAPAAGAVTVAVPEQPAQQRSNLYGFLATVYRAEVTADLLQRLRQPEFASALAAAGVALDDDFLDRPEDEVLDDLAVEYARLFIGPGRHIPPYASVHGEADGGELWGRTVGPLREFIAAAGLAYAPSYTGLPDHISVELECMAGLTARSAAAETAGCDAEAARWRDLERDFFERFLAPWMPRFCRRVVAATRSSFYREMARLTEAFIAAERQTPRRLH